MVEEDIPVIDLNEEEAPDYPLDASEDLAFKVTVLEKLDKIIKMLK